MNAPTREDQPSLKRVVSVCTADQGGGAERMAWTLFDGYRRRGLESWLAVGAKKSNDPDVIPFFQSPHIDYRPYQSWWFRFQEKLAKWTAAQRGIEDFRFPFCKHLMAMTGARPDVVHCHNLHGGFFDLRVLAEVSPQVPTFLTLHDCWSFTGHCAYPMGCPRWQTGCGACPHLAVPPAVRRDATACNWRRKRDIYQKCRLHVAAPTRWLLDQARRSILASAAMEFRLIRYGLDLEIFHPGDRALARASLGIPADADVLLFVANLGANNPFKDFETLRATVRLLAYEPRSRPLQLICVGAAAPVERHGAALIRHVPMIAEPRRLANYYRAADVYVHAAKQEVFGIVITEALACGIPVAATDVGGIAEAFTHGVHGFLSPPADSQSLAYWLTQLLDDAPLRQRLGRNAAVHAQSTYDLEDMIQAYLTWFDEVLAMPKDCPSRDRQGAT